ncbi:MAG: methyltransferase family protein, partial [Armatimonadota bacterium]
MTDLAPTERPEVSPEVARGVRKWFIKTFIGIPLPAVILCLCAGRWDWTMAWVYAGMMLAMQALTAAVLLPSNPELLAERSQLQKGSKTWDTVLVILGVGIGMTATWVVAGLDLRFGWLPPFPLPLSIIAVAVGMLGIGLLVWAMAANRFFSATVRIQTERGHTVATGGPYRYVRHPGYVGWFMLTLASPVVLGSQWALVPTGISALLMVLRTALEDRTLQNELEGYKE